MNAQAHEVYPHTIVTDWNRIFVLPRPTICGVFAGDKRQISFKSLRSKKTLPSGVQEDKVEHEGLQPIVGSRADVLILGSFPGEMSLRKQEYYAHPRNLFWDIMECIVGAGRDKDYPSRIEQLKNNGICLWDVLKSCNRDGSLDTRIRNGQFNNFNSFLSRHQVRVIFFNGKKSAEAFNRNVVPGLKYSIQSHVLPSTSPAHTRMTKEEKFKRWCLVKKYLYGTGYQKSCK